MTTIRRNDSRVIANDCSIKHPAPCAARRADTVPARTAGNVVTGFGVVPLDRSDQRRFPMSADQPTGSHPSDEELRLRLTPEEYHVTQEKGTERAFTGRYWDCHDEGVYRCVVCDAELFTSDTKYESGSGWPSFWQPASSGAVAEAADRSYGMVRTEAVCASCGAHLGHVFDDGPRPTGLRYCMNSASLRLEPGADRPGADRPGDDARPAPRS